MKTRRVRVVMNGVRRPVHLITDRAKRYRANSSENRPGPPKQCGFCGSKKNVGVDHVNGHESDASPRNLMWACKKCNTKKGFVLRKAGIGKLTRQYNPKPRGMSRRRQLEEYGQAIKVMRGQFDGDVAAAVALIRATPPAVRSEYTSRTWATRKQVYGPSGRG